MVASGLLGVVIVCYGLVGVVLGVVRLGGSDATESEDEYDSETVLRGEYTDQPDDATERISCPSCSALNDARFAFCQVCVTPLDRPQMPAE